MYAMVEILGKQYKAEKGGLLKVDKIEAEEGKDLDFDTVLLFRGDDSIKVGAPYVEGAKVTAVLEKHAKGDKVIVYKYKRRKDYQRKQGHRQNYSFIRIKEVSLA
ncbi:50S ribosomal protein L21 [Spirochaeta lutea]|uniref:Large ribosomal subunit protein bL21 n=1 Tax=Spirochaeta lutea TaxID=1480694 RepID=A0A098R175_9SPIO|nr:50S ribosomal protein L21 [Spirochaeta lutea]KGE73860.1 50S ribosomal protein L21 [Spirochaeta lutea]